MMEPQEDIDSLLDMMGEVMSFSWGEIKGIPGFDTSILYKGEVTPYEIEKQNIVFITSTKNILENNVKIDDKFTYTDGSYIYTFQIDRTPMQDITGYSELRVNLLKKGT